MFKLQLVKKNGEAFEEKISEQVLAENGSRGWRRFDNFWRQAFFTDDIFLSNLPILSGGNDLWAAKLNLDVTCGMLKVNTLRHSFFNVMELGFRKLWPHRGTFI